MFIVINSEQRDVVLRVILCPLPIQSYHTMPQTFTHRFNSPLYTGTVSVNTGLFIDGKFVDSVDKNTIE